MLWAGKVFEELMVLSVTVEDKETERFGEIETVVGNAVSTTAGMIESVIEGIELTVVVIVPITKRHGILGKLGGNVLLDNERTDLRDDYTHPSVKTQFGMVERGNKLLCTCGVARGGRDRAMI